MSASVWGAWASVFKTSWILRNCVKSCCNTASFQKRRALPASV